MNFLKLGKLKKLRERMHLLKQKKAYHVEYHVILYQWHQSKYWVSVLTHKLLNPTCVHYSWTRIYLRL